MARGFVDFRGLGRAARTLFMRGTDIKKHGRYLESLDKPLDAIFILRHDLYRRLLRLGFLPFTEFTARFGDDRCHAEFPGRGPVISACSRAGKNSFGRSGDFVYDTFRFPPSDFKAHRGTDAQMGEVRGAGLDAPFDLEFWRRRPRVYLFSILT